MGKIVDAVVLVLYPLIVYFGINHLGVRWTALVLLLVVGRRFALLVITNRSTSRIVLFQAASMAAIIGIAAASRSEFALRAVPFIISLTFIGLFASSLKHTPLIERFARLQKPKLPPDHVRYCRNLTKIWVGVLAINSLILFAAMLQDDKALWAILVGPVSFGFLGLVFAVEYPFRKWRFQEFNPDNPLDRILRALLKREHAS
jgi:uncharacterized membrane protein